MTQQEARQRAAQLNRELAADAEQRWIAHHGEDGWTVVRLEAGGLSLPAAPGAPGSLLGGRGPEREEPIDPRPTLTRLIPPVGPPGV